MPCDANGPPARVPAVSASSQRDPAEAHERLTAWLGARPGASGAEVSALEMPASTGFSHETLLFDARWTEGGVDRSARLVARVEPTQHTVFLDPDFAAEYRVMRALSERTGVRVPAPLAFEENPSWLGSRFYVVQRRDGAIPSDSPPYTFGGWLVESSPEEQARVWWSGLEAMAEVHRVEPSGFEFLARPADGAPGVDEQLGYWRAYAEWCAGGTMPDQIAGGLGWLEANRPAEQDLALCWGDSRLGNQIFESGRCIAVLDWEMAAIADPSMDLAWWLYMDRVFSEGLGIGRLPGFPGRAETIARWERLTGRRARAMEFYEIFAALRFALVMMRLGHLMVSSARLPPEADFGTNNFAIHFLGRLLGAGVGG